MIAPKPTSWRSWAPWLSPAATAVLLFISVGFIGFHPSDDGMLLAQTQRILRGEVPHLDVIFARPMGSAFLHILDFVIPLPLFEASRLTGISEIVAYSYLFAWFTYSKAPVHWGLMHHLGAIGAALVNLHTFPSMAWYTTDGLLFTALGFVLLQRGLAKGSPEVPAIGLLALGIAPLMKQSFFLSPVLGVIWVALALRVPLRFRTTTVALFWAGLPIAVYLAALAPLGAIPEFSRQLLGAAPVWGKELLASILVPSLALLVTAFGALIAFVISSDRKSEDGEGTGESWESLFRPDVWARLGMTGALILLPTLGRFDREGLWGISLTWILIGYALIALVLGLRDFPALALIAVAWMTSLSWGYPFPNLVAGTLALHVVHGIWQGFRIRNPEWKRLRPLGLVAALLATTILGVGLIGARRQAPYFDLPAPELTATLSEVSPRFGSIRTNPITADYLAQVASCVERFPASRVAVLPDNPGIYPALNLHNPFPMDWMYIHDTIGHNARIRDSARALDARGGYLVLFQTIPIGDVPSAGDLKPAGLAAVPFSYDKMLTAGILGELSGERVVCGVFIGSYSP